MGDLKRHPMYVGLEWDCLVAKTLPAPWVPVEIPLRAEPGCIPGASDVYTGDQVSSRSSTCQGLFKALNVSCKLETMHLALCIDELAFAVTSQT